MSARTNYTVAAVVAVAVLGATAGYVYLNQTDTAEPFGKEVVAEQDTPSIDIADIGADLDAASGKTPSSDLVPGGSIELETAPAINVAPPIEANSLPEAATVEGNSGTTTDPLPE